MSAAEGREIECSRGRTLLTLACAYSRASILSFPAPPVVTDTFRLTSPRTQRILLKTVTVFKGEPIAFIFPLEHQVHVERCADKRRQKAASAATRRPDNNLGFVSTTGPHRTADVCGFTRRFSLLYLHNMTTVALQEIRKYPPTSVYIAVSEESDSQRTKPLPNRAMGLGSSPPSIQQ